MERETSRYVDSEVEVLKDPDLLLSSNVSRAKEERDRTTGKESTIRRSRSEKQGRDSGVDCSGSQCSSEYKYELPKTQPTALDPHNFGLRRRKKRKQDDKLTHKAYDDAIKKFPKRFVSLSSQGGQKSQKEAGYDSDTLRKYAEHCAMVDNDPE